MGLISFKHRGSFKNTEDFFNRSLKRNYVHILDRYGQLGVELLQNATPVESGKTASSWFYEIKKSKGTVSISWHNSNVNDGVNVVILLMYGHGLHNGGYVQGNDFVHPTIRPVMEEIAKKAWEEVTE